MNQLGLFDVPTLTPMDMIIRKEGLNHWEEKLRQCRAAEARGCPEQPELVRYYLARLTYDMGWVTRDGRRGPVPIDPRRTADHGD